MRGTVWHLRAVTRGALHAARRLAGALPAGDFYLAGGTGLALRLGHRVSVDLDLFSALRKLRPTEREEVLRRLEKTGPVKIEEARDGMMHLLLDTTHVSLLRYPYPLLAKPDPWTPGTPSNPLLVASLTDIGLMKVAAVLGRGAKKDFVDLRAVCREVSLEKLLLASRRKFPSHRDFLVQAVKALVYFEDADRDPMPRLLRPCSWEGVKGYFEKEVPAVLRRVLS